jgi:DNA-binding XRE family transcriptional regulator
LDEHKLRHKTEASIPASHLSPLVHGLPSTVQCLLNQPGKVSKGLQAPPPHAGVNFDNDTGCALLDKEMVGLLTFVSGRYNRRLLKLMKETTLPHKLNLSRFLRDARIKRGLSVAEVAEEIGVSTASIYFWERDHCRPRAENLSALCKVLRLPIRATRELAAA